ncbi:MAG: N-acetyltransferase family protein [Granulosicoccus sp.]
MNSFSIRQAAIEDASVILDFVTELAVFEKAEHEVLTSVAAIENTMFSESATAKAIIGELDKQPIAMAVYFFNYSTWLGKNGLYLEDLYVSDKHRGIGAGRKMLRHLARLALEEDCGRFEWSVLDWNLPAIGLYNAVGAVAREEWISYRLSGSALENFASEADG